MSSLLALLLAASTGTAGSADTAPIPNRDCTTDEASAFDFWLGYWTAEVWTRKFGEHPAFHHTASLRSEVSAELDGCVIVERVEFQTQPDKQLTAGYSARFLDTSLGKWRALLLWPSAERSRPYEMTGGFRHGRAEFYRTVHGVSEKPLLSRFTFSDITEESLRWDSSVASESWSEVDFEENLASTWFTEAKFEFQRVEKHSRPLRQAIGCQSQVNAVSEALVGSWATAAPALQLRVAPVAAGCAFEIWLGRDGSTIGYALLAYASENPAWQLFSFAPGTLHRASKETVFEASFNLGVLDGDEFSLVIPEHDDELRILENGSSIKLLRVGPQ